MFRMTLTLILALFSALSWGNFSASTPSFSQSQFVTVDEAFTIDVIQYQDQVRVQWQVKPDYYLYQSRMQFIARDANITAIDLEDGTPYQDEFFGDVNIYTDPVTAAIHLTDIKNDNAELIVEYQGCAKAGFCYPPERRVFPLAGNTDQDTSTNSSEQLNSHIPQSKEADFATKLSTNSWTPLLFLALGIGLAFTPCVFPMYPIITSIVVGQQASAKRTRLLAFLYVQGMALTYTLLGLIVASVGVQFQAALQHPAILIAISVLFVLLALSMFGVYTLQLPANLQTKLSNWSNQQTAGNATGVFIMGAISGLVCSPCTTAPLSGALLYVAQSGDLLTGAIALYFLALGMGIPLMIIAIYGNKLLPKSGPWMERVKQLFGFILLAAPIFFLERLLPQLWTSLLWTLLGITTFGWLYILKNQFEFAGWKQTAIGTFAVLGMIASTLPTVQFYQAQSHPHIEFIQIKNVKQLNEQLSNAKQQQKPVMLDFYADWCSACKEFEKYTFHTPQVEPLLKDFVLLQADVTANKVGDIALLKHLNVLGLPTIEFWDATGKSIPHAKITGFMPAQEFADHIKDHVHQ